MKPIQERAELALEQGLRCVQYRLPNRYQLRPSAYSCALALRYGLIGAAAAYYALEMADLHEERELKNVFLYWPLMVTEHFKSEVHHRLPFDSDAASGTQVGKLSGSPLRISLALRKQFLPLQRVMEIATEVFCRDHRSEILADVFLLQRPRMLRLFREASQDSVDFAIHFFERRRAGLEEVSEIALLGE